MNEITLHLNYLKVLPAENEVKKELNIIEMLKKILVIFIGWEILSFSSGFVHFSGIIARNENSKVY